MAKPDRICELAEGEQLPFHWSDVKKDKLLVINHKDDSTNWSQKFKIDQIDTLMVKLRPRTPSLEKQYELISVTIKERDGVRFIVFRPGEDNYIELYRIVNQTTEYISLQQKGHETIDIIPPKTASAYFWEEPHVPQGRLLMMKVHNLKNGAPCVISLDVDPRTHPDWEPKNAYVQLYNFIIPLSFFLWRVAHLLSLVQCQLEVQGPASPPWVQPRVGYI
jgi:hypothetical protein